MSELNRVIVFTNKTAPYKTDDLTVEINFNNSVTLSIYNSRLHHRQWKSLSQSEAQQLHYFLGKHIEQLKKDQT
jgi:hypothetical protein